MNCLRRITIISMYLMVLISIGQSFTWRSSLARRSSPLRMVAFDYSREKIDLLYDSECPLCAMEVEFLKKRDIHQRIRFTDLSSPDYNPQDHGNVEYIDGMKKLRAVLPGDKVITGVEVFRVTYEAIGLGWVFAFTNLPVLGKLADTAYDFWAENRLRITGRGDLADLMKERAEVLNNMEFDGCGTEACDLMFEDDEEQWDE